VDLLRYDLKGPVGAASMKKMTPLVQTVTTAPGAPPPSPTYGMNFPCVTADTRLNVLLVYLQHPPPNNLRAYSPDTDSWQIVETDVPAEYRRLVACDYSPDHGVHAYWGGQGNATDSNIMNEGWGTITLTGEQDSVAPAKPFGLKMR
jgi:hypothetical protein